MAKPRTPQRGTAAKKAREAKPGLFAELIQLERYEDARTLEEMAERMQVSKSHLSDIEKGRKLVSLERAAHFAELLGIDLERVARVILQDQIDRAGLALTVAVSSKTPRRRATD